MNRNATADVVFLLDVDNTLLDNDRIIADLRSHLEAAFGGASAACYWAAFETLRTELGYADYLGALQRYRADVQRQHGSAHVIAHTCQRQSRTSGRSSPCSLM